ncbi:MAG: hypothetical protein H6634_16560 [Anaerolineales bacterium]|nr:hypothetical protein [Anaerolineales bacterium]
MSEQGSKPVIPQQWKIDQIKDSQIIRFCDACQQKHAYNAAPFTGKTPTPPEGLTKTDQVVRRNYGQQVVAWIVALIVYYNVHQWVNGEGTPLNQGILVPVFVAVLAYSIVLPLFSAGLFGGKGIPIYSLQCSNCGADIYFATDGKSIAIPSVTQKTAKPQPQQSSIGATLPKAAEEVKIKDTVTDSSVTAEAMRNKFLQDGETCWYCQKDKPANGKPHNSVVQMRNGNDWVRKTVWVPRCSDCEIVHAQETPYFKIILPIALVAFVVLCFAVGILANNAIGFWSWASGIFVLTIGGVAAILVVQKIIQSRAVKAGTRAQALANSEFPDVHDLLGQGWQLDTAHTGEAK